MLALLTSAPGLLLPLAIFGAGRPAECALQSGRANAGSTNVWERAKSPELRRYCDLLAGAASKLAGGGAMAQAALASAAEADGILPGHAAPLVLQGRALASLGRLEEASTAFRAGKERDPGALDDPAALLAWARVLARTGHGVEAVEAYRALLPRTLSLPASERASAAVESGLVSMASGPSGLDTAASALREALRAAQDDVEGVAVLALALVLDRRGSADEARALLATRAHGDPRTVLEGTRAKELLRVAPADAQAMIALALTPLDPAGAHEAWTQYLGALPPSAANGPFAVHARNHLGALGKPGRGAP